MTAPATPSPMMPAPAPVPSYEDVLARLAEADPRLLVMTAENRAAIRNLPARLGPRFIDVGIAEQTMVGMAAGLALRGRVPVVHALATFLTLRAFEFIRTDVGIGNLPVKLVGYVPGFLSEANGPTHQAVDDVAVMRAIPRMQIFCPSDDAELAAGLPDVLASKRPAYIRFNARPSTLAHAPFALGRAETLTTGDDIGVLAAGLLVPAAAEACGALSATGIGARLVNLRTLSPVDEAAIVDLATRCRVLVTLEDHLLVGGLYSLVAEVLVRNRISVPVVPLALEARYFRPGRLADVLEYEGFNARWLMTRFRQALEEHGAARVVPIRPRPLPATDGYPSIVASDALYARAVQVIPGATQTLAKGVGQHVRGVAPKYLQSGRGARVTDVDGNEYLDLTMGVGPLILGYREPTVDAAIRDQLASGITFSLPHPLEVEVAELIRSLVPGAEAVRYAKNGCDVTTAAVRLARAFTGRDKVLCCGYHGWHDWYIGVTDRDRGVPADVAALTHTFPYNDLDAIASVIDDETACVILEPTTFEAPREDFLAGLKRLCAARGVLLIFDEMWTGFRLALGGAQQRFGVTADLACFSKAVANGMPLAVLTGRADVMKLLEKDVFFYSTFGGEALSLAAARATLTALRDRQVPTMLELTGGILRDQYNRLAESAGVPFTRCAGFGCRTLVSFAPQGIAAGADPLVMKSFVQQELIRRGFLWGGFHNLSAAHTSDDLRALLAAYGEILPELRAALEKGTLAEALRGQPLEAVFRRTSNFNMKPRPAPAKTGAHASA